MEFEKQLYAQEHIKEYGGILFAKDISPTKNTKRYIVFESYTDSRINILNIFNENINTHYYEIIPENVPVKLFLDIDYKITSPIDIETFNIENTIDCFINKMKYEYTQIKNHKVFIIDSSNDIKLSFHIIFEFYDENNNIILFTDVKNLKEFIHQHKEDYTKEHHIDPNVYTKNRCFRLIYNSKISNPTRILKPYKNNTYNILDTLVCYTDKNIKTVNYTKKTKKQLMLEASSSVITKNTDIHFDEIFNEKSFIMSLLSLISQHSIKHIDWLCICTALYNIYNGSIEGLDMYNSFAEMYNKHHNLKDEYKEQRDNLYKTQSGEYKNNIGTIKNIALRLSPTDYSKLLNEKVISCNSYLSGTDDSLADLFINMYSASYIIVNDIIYKYNLNTGIWIPDNNEYAIKNQICNLSKLINEDTIKLSNTIEPDIKLLKRRRNIINKLENHNTKISIIKSIKHKTNCDIELDIDKPTGVINKIAFNNGVYDVNNYIFRQALYDEYITLTTGIEYKYCDDITYKNTIDFIKDIIPDNDVYNFIMSKLSAYVCNNPNIYLDHGKEFFIFSNSSGSNGKSSFLSLFENLLGKDKMFYSASPLLLSDRNLDPNCATPAYINLPNKRIIWFNEPNSNVKLSGNIIKKFCSDEDFSVRPLYKESKNVNVIGMPILVCNDIPKIDSCDGGVLRRVFVINFPSIFVNPDDFNPDNKYHRIKKSYSKQQMKDMSYGLLRILIDFSKKGMFNTPNEVLKYTNQYKNDINKVKSFCEEYIIRDDNSILKKNVLMSYLKQNKLKYEYFDDLDSNDIMKKIAQTLNTKYIDKKSIRIDKDTVQTIRSSIIGFNVREYEL